MEWRTQSDSEGLRAAAAGLEGRAAHTAAPGRPKNNCAALRRRPLQPTGLPAPGGEAAWASRRSLPKASGLGSQAPGTRWLRASAKKGEKIGGHFVGLSLCQLPYERHASGNPTMLDRADITLTQLAASCNARHRSSETKKDPLANGAGLCCLRRNSIHGRRGNLNDYGEELVIACPQIDAEKLSIQRLSRQAPFLIDESKLRLLLLISPGPENQVQIIGRGTRREGSN